jgi:RluA family pseudouridine synthase
MFIQQVLKTYKNIEIIFENNEFIIINKPHGMVVIEGRNRDDDVGLYDALRAKYKKLYLIHRLDAPVGGLMVLAKTKKFCAKLTKQFEQHRVIKKYLCFCDGIIDNPLTLMLPVSKRNYRGKYKINFVSGKKSITTFYPVGKVLDKSIVIARPITGRTHQIRLHLKSLGAPIMGDYLYNKNYKKPLINNAIKIPLFAFYLEFEGFTFQVRPSEYFLNFIYQYKMDHIIDEFYEKIS